MIKHCGNSKIIYKKVLQEIIYRAQLTTINLNLFYITKDKTKPYLAKLINNFIKIIK